MISAEMPANRSKKPTDSLTAVQKSSKSTTQSTDNEKPSMPQPDGQPAIVGGLNGDYRITGTGQSDGSRGLYKEFTVPAEKDKVIPCRLYGPEPESSSTNKSILIFTHGAGGGLDNPATELFAEGYAALDMPILMFQGTMNLQSRTKHFEILLDYCKKQYPGCEYAAGGRSMGARAAVMLAAQRDEVQKIVAVSYPLVSPKGDMRDQILIDLSGERTVLFVTGGEDGMCDRLQLDEVRAKMAASSNAIINENMDHGMSFVGKVKDKARKTTEVRKEDGGRAARWVRGTASNDAELLKHNWMARRGTASVKEAKAGQTDGKAKSIKSAKKDEGNRPDFNKQAKPSNNTTKRKLTTKSASPNAPKTASKRRKVTSDKKAEEEDSMAPRRSARLKQ